MIRKAETLAMTVLLVGLYCTPGWGQATPNTILVVDVANDVRYFEDIFDVSKLATSPNATPATVPPNFARRIEIGDIVAVNGQPAKGTMVFHQQTINLRTAPTPGQAIADTVANAILHQTFEMQTADGNPIGTIMASGLGGGPPPPGAPLSVTQGNNMIVGGTGAFLGARGQVGQAVGAITIPVRQASWAEDPANRRRNGGGTLRFVLTVIPLSVPQIVATPGGPAVTHSSDFSLVTASKPAAAGEILSLFVTGLGPTRPGVDPGKPFPASPLAAVNSPVDVTVNGKPAEVTAAVGFPGAVDGYQVNFRVPSETPRGTATIQVTAAWISGPEVRIPVQ